MALSPLRTAQPAPRDHVYEWEGRDRHGKKLNGELRAAGEAAVQASLRRQGIYVQKLKRRRDRGGRAIKPKDIALFTRQLATMMRAGVPLLQSFDIVGRGSTNPRVTALLNAIRQDVETGTSLSTAFRRHPMHFSALYCNLVEAGEAAGILETLLERLALYQEKTLEVQRKIRGALVYPIAVLAVAFIVVTIIMIFVIPAFKEVFSSFGADLPAPTLLVMALSDAFVRYWYLLFGGLGLAGVMGYQSWRRSERLQRLADRWLLKLPVFGALVEKSILARWCRTLATMFAAGVPLVDALDSVGGAAGNAVFREATELIQRDVTTGTSLTVAMRSSGAFPVMVLQMAEIGEEAGSLDHMLGKAAEFYEQEVDEAVKALSSLLEPMIIVVLGTLIGGIVVAMYLPIFRLGQVV